MPRPRSRSNQDPPKRRRLTHGQGEAPTPLHFSPARKHPNLQTEGIWVSHAPNKTGLHSFTQAMSAVHIPLYSRERFGDLCC